MATDQQLYGEIETKADMKEVFEDIRRDVDDAKTRATLTELYRRAGYLITLTYAPSWQSKFGQDVQALRKLGRDEFHKTARRINRKAEEIGAEPDYDEDWGQ